MYKLFTDTEIIRLTDRVTIPMDPKNADYQVYQEWLEDGNTPEAATPLPEPGPSRDDRLLAAVAKANDGVDSALDVSADFTAKQKAVLKTILKGAFTALGKAGSGEPL